jgi:hypothetical protein
VTRAKETIAKRCSYVVSDSQQGQVWLPSRLNSTVEHDRRQADSLSILSLTTASGPEGL